MNAYQGLDYFMQDWSKFCNNRFDEVTHNYERENRFNLWFTLIAQSRERIGEIISRVKSLPGVEEVRDLPADEMYKIKVNFRPPQ